MTEGRQKVIVAMSGGVDSSVAAALLKEAGYDVTGVFLCLGMAEESSAPRGCCSPQDAADARRVADRLGIGLYVVNVAESFAPIIERFLDEYAAGRTPNPCILCNSLVKFGRLLEHADRLGVRYVATGHYARVIRHGGRAAIARGQAGGKDQSYALFGVAGAALERMLLPLGQMPDKQAVRSLARRLDLPVHDKPDSQEICFVPDDDYVRLLAARRPEALRGGNIVDCAGRVLGRHDGYARYTIGQRRGLRVAAGVPMYVTDIDPASATVTIGPLEQVQSSGLKASGATWHADVPEQFDAVVQVRYNHSGAPARVTVTGADSFEVQFLQPVAAITAGQAAVVYEGDVLLGGGWIDR